MMQLDNLHYNFSKIDGYNKDFNFVISPREAGKTTSFLNKSYRAYSLYNRPTILFRRYGTDITDAYISSLEDVINKFLDKPIRFFYNKGTKKEGITDIRTKKDGPIFFRIIALNQPMSRIKSLFLKNAAYMFMDEFICNTRMGEKYIREEGFKFKEIYNTFQRESEHLKAYFCGNSYSIFNPYFSEFGIPESKIKPGTITVGENWAVERYILNPELVKAILAKNPLYKFSNDEYSKYAVEGNAINDENILIMRNQPRGFKLLISFIIDGKNLGVYRSPDREGNLDYWVGYLNDVGDRRKIFCFDFKDLTARSTLFSSEDRMRLADFRNSVRNRYVAFESLEADYLIEEIYSNL